MAESIIAPAPTLEEVRTALEGVDGITIRMMQGVVQVTFENSEEVTTRIAALLSSQPFTVRTVVLQNADGRTRLHVNDDGSVLQQEYNALSELKKTQMHPYPAFEPAKAG